MMVKACAPIVAAAALLGATAVGAMPVHDHSITKRDGPTAVDDITILQYALTLEHVEHAFYVSGLTAYSDQDFIDAGYDTWVRGRIQQIGDHETDHVAFLTDTIGENATQACTYSFPYTDVASFVTMVAAIEGVGTSAYLGAANHLTNTDYLRASASILATEARQVAWAKSAALGGSPWSTEFETPLEPSGAYSIASQFIVSCPDTNPTLPIKSFPAMTVDPASPTAGSTITVSVNSTSNSTDTTYLAYYTGLQVYSSEIVDGQTTVPSNLTGIVYASVVNYAASSDDLPTDDTIVSGFTSFDFGVPADARQLNLTGLGY